MNGVTGGRMTLFRAFATLFAVALLAGCAAEPVRVVSPPEIIEVPRWMPLPDDCGIQWPVALPPGSSAADVMLEQREVIDAYKDQVDRCFKGADDGT